MSSRAPAAPSRRPSQAAPVARILQPSARPGPTPFRNPGVPMACSVPFRRFLVLTSTFAPTLALPLALALAGAGVAARPAHAAIAVTIDRTLDRRAVSPLVYGVNF